MSCNNKGRIYRWQESGGEKRVSPHISREEGKGGGTSLEIKDVDYSDTSTTSHLLFSYN